MGRSAAVGSILFFGGLIAPHDVARLPDCEAHRRPTLYRRLILVLGDLCDVDALDSFQVSKTFCISLKCLLL